MQAEVQMNDIFISHASEDKQSVVRPLADSLRGAGLEIWYDEFSLKLGDSLRRSIDRGIAESRFGLVVISPSFFAKKWPQEELNGLFSKEIGGQGTIIPVWHDITYAEVLAESPILADRLAGNTNQGTDRLVEQILDTIDPNRIHKSNEGQTLAITPISLRLFEEKWAVTTPVTIANLSNDPAYSVMVRIEIFGSGVEAASLDLEGDPQIPDIEASVGGVSLLMDQIRLNCETQDGKQVAYFIFHTILPKASRTLTVKGTEAVKSTAKISIASFELTPRELLTEKQGKAAILVNFQGEKVCGINIRRKPN